MQHNHHHKHDIPAECPASKCPEMSASKPASQCPAADDAAKHIKTIKDTFNLKSDAEAVATALKFTAHMATAHAPVAKNDDCCHKPKPKAHGMDGCCH